VISGYVEQPSPLAGGTLRLRVATDAPQFRAVFYRWGSNLTRSGSTAWFSGRDVPPHLPFQDWGEEDRGLAGERLERWPCYVLSVPAEWTSGCYLAVLVEGDGCGQTLSAEHPVLDGPSAAGGRGGFTSPEVALFVVRPRRPAAGHRLLYKVPLFTYHAYNLVQPVVYDPASGQGHWCLYNMPQPQDVPGSFPPSVSLHRPGGGAGGAPFDTFNFDPLDPTPRQTFGHWDARMVSWLEGEGYGLDCW
jgi:hypothetical protein